MDHQLALLQNIATNGRWFCALLAVINAAAGNYRLAILAAVPIGLACIVDQLPATLSRHAWIGSLGTYLLAVIVAVASLLALG